MKIAMVSEHASPLAALGGTECGGQNLHVAELAAALARCGNEVTVYTRRDDPRQQPEVTTDHGYRVVHVPAGPAAAVPRDELVPWLGDFVSHLANRWRYDRPDVVHSHFWMSGMVALLAGQEHDIPVVHTYHALGTVKRRHQGEADTSPPQRIQMERLIGRKAARVVATCADEVFELVQLGLSRTRISIVPCGVDCTLFTPDPGRPGGRHRPLRVLTAGRLVPRKGFDDAITAIAKVPDAELVVAGGPAPDQLRGDAEARRLLALAGDLGVTDRVRLFGRVTRPEMAALMRAADIVVCAPWYEPFGLVALEAMASGTPVVAAAVGGLADTVVHGVTGEHVPPRHPDALAVTLRDLATDTLKREKYGVAGRDRAVSRYTWERVAGDTLRVYEQACGAEAPQRPESAVAVGALR